MTNEAVEKLAEKHGGAVIDYSLQEGPQATDTTIIIATSDLAALIAEVEQRVAREIVNHIGQSVPTTKDTDWADGYKAAVLDVVSGVCVRFLTGEEGK